MPLIIIFCSPQVAWSMPCHYILESMGMKHALFRYFCGFLVRLWIQQQWLVKFGMQRDSPITSVVIKQKNNLNNGPGKSQSQLWNNSHHYITVQHIPGDSCRSHSILSSVSRPVQRLLLVHISCLMKIPKAVEENCCRKTKRDRKNLQVKLFKYLTKTCNISSTI